MTSHQPTPSGPAGALRGDAPPAAPTPAGGIDSRGPRFGAAVTAALLVVVLLLGSGTAARAVLGVVVALFAVASVRGVEGSVQGALFRRLVRPRLGPPRELEDRRPPRFAQRVGLLITGTGLVLALLGVEAALPVAAAVALVAAFLNAAVGFCLGCEMYLLLQRARRA